MQTSINNTVEWLKEQLERTGTQGFVVGLSGGIDSSVVVRLCQMATDNVVGVIMPIGNPSIDEEYAWKLVETNNINARAINLDATYESYVQAIELENESALVKGNLKARIRMSTLYAIAQSKNYLVVGTDNAAEWYTGYFTKYGDGGVDLVPIIHYEKNEVYKMGHLLNVPSEILDRAPTASLWESQTDEEEMGVTYAQIDAFLRGEKIDFEAQQIIHRMHLTTEHKRNLAVGPTTKL